MSDSNRTGTAGRHRLEDDRQNGPGELCVSVGIQRDKVVLNFGKAVAWLAVDPAEARIIAVMLLERAAQLDGKSTTLKMGVGS